jgi:hypothetical protein
MMGGSIIMPMPMRVDATTMSMTKEGDENDETPVGRRSFSSEMTKAGIKR